jgi:8-oxo-dGTP pyrophosphatase MutT (NUDIX family)
VASTIPLRRAGYRIAFRVLQVRWRLLHPRLEGVKCLITDGERVLLVRHTYGPRAWDLPGGMSRRGETPDATARREMAEELGLPPLPWTPLGQLRGRMFGRHDAIHVLGAEVRDPPLHLDPGELAAAAWFPRDRLPLWRSRLLEPLVAAGLLDPKRPPHGGGTTNRRG